MITNHRRFPGLIAILALAFGCGGGGSGTQVTTQQQPVKEWSASTVIEPNYIFSYLLREPFFASDTKGNRMALFLRSENTVPRLYATYYSSNSKAWGTSQPIQSAGTSGDFPALVMTDSGHAVAIWRQVANPNLQLMTASFDPSTGWSAPQTLSPDVRMYKITCRGENVVIIWNPASAPGNILNARRFSVANGWDSVETLPTPSGATIGQFQIAIDTAGNRLAVWDQIIDSWNNGVYASTYAPIIGWGIPTLLNAPPVPGTAGYNPRVVMKVTGDALVTWAQYNDPNSPSNPVGTYYRKYSPSVGWGPASFAILGVVDVLTMNDAGLVLALGPTPNPRIANAIFSLQSATFNGSFWRDLSVLPAPPTTGLGSNSPSVAVDTAGNFILAFLAQQPSPSGSYDAWTARFNAASLAWTTPAKLPGQSSDVDALQVISLPNSEASALWIPRSGSGVGAISSDYK